MRRPLAIVGGMIGALLLAGCGVTSHVQATHSYDGAKRSHFEPNDEAKRTRPRRV